MEVVFVAIKYVAVDKQVAKFGLVDDMSIWVVSVERKLSGYHLILKELQAGGGCSYLFLGLFSGRSI